MKSAVASITRTFTRQLVRTPSTSACTLTAVRFASSTTYSGGHAYEGQGGFYGSIKSRSDLAAEFIPGSRAEPTDVKLLDELIAAWTTQSESLTTTDEQLSALEALARVPTNNELVKRLIVKGGPAWGLSVKQREFVSRFHRVVSASAQ